MPMTVDEETSRSRWDGVPLDLDLCTEMPCQIARRGDRESSSEGDDDG